VCRPGRDERAVGVPVPGPRVAVREQVDLGAAQNICPVRAPGHQDQAADQGGGGVMVPGRGQGAGGRSRSPHPGCRVGAGHFLVLP